MHKYEIYAAAHGYDDEHLDTAKREREEEQNRKEQEEKRQRAEAAEKAAQEEATKRAEQKKKQEVEALIKRKQDTPVKFRKILVLYTTDKLLPALKNLDYNQFSADLTFCKQEQLLTPDEIVNLEKINAILKIYSSLIKETKEVIITIDQAITGKDFAVIAECLSLPELHSKPIHELRFAGWSVEDKESKEPVDAPLVTLLQRVEKITISNCTLSDGFVSVLERAKHKTAKDFNVRDLSLTAINTEPALLQRVLNLVPSPAINIELTDKGYFVSTSTNAHSKLRIGHVVGDTNALLKMLSAGNQKQLELSDIAFTKDLVLQDDDLTELALDKTSMFLSSFVEGGSFATSLKNLPKLQTLIIKSPTFHNKEARITCLRAVISTKELALKHLDLSHCVFEEQELEELIPYLTNNPHLVSLNLTGNKISESFLAKLEKVILESNMCLTDIIPYGSMPQKLKTALLRNDNKDRHLKNLQKAEAAFMLASTDLQLEREDISPHEILQKIQEEFLQDHQAMQSCAAAFYPTPEHADKLQTRYHLAVVNIFTKWLHTDRAKPEEIFFCHQQALELLQKTLSWEKQGEVLIPYLQKKAQQLVDIYNREGYQTKTYNHFDYILRLGARIKNDELVYHGCLVLIAITNKIINEKQCYHFVNQYLPKFIEQLSSASAKKAYKILLEALCTKKSLLLSKYALSTAKMIRINIAPCYLAHLRNLHDLILSPDTDLAKTFKKLKQVTNILSEIEKMQFEGKQNVINMVHFIINTSATHLCKPFSLPEKLRPDAETFDAKLVTLLMLPLASTFKELHESTVKNITAIYRNQILKAIAATVENLTHADQLYDEKHVSSTRCLLAKKTRDATNPQMLCEAIDTYLKKVWRIKNRELLQTLKRIQSELQPIVRQLLEMKLVTFTHCELPDLKSDGMLADKLSLKPSIAVAAAPYPALVLETKAAAVPTDETKEFTRAGDLDAEINNHLTAKIRVRDQTDNRVAAAQLAQMGGLVVKPASANEVQLADFPVAPVRPLEKTDVSSSPKVVIA